MDPSTEAHRSAKCRAYMEQGRKQHNRGATKAMRRADATQHKFEHQPKALPLSRGQDAFGIVGVVVAWATSQPFSGHTPHKPLPALQLQHKPKY